MRKFFGLGLVSILFFAPSRAIQAAEKDAQAILDKAITALGGEEKLKGFKSASWKSKGKIYFGGNESDIEGNVIAQGLDHYRFELELALPDNKIKGLIVLAGDKGWRNFGDMKTVLEGGELANQKRGTYLLVIPMTLLPLKEKGFQIEAGKEEKVNDKPAVSLKVTPPDKKEFTLYFDKESGLPVKQVAKVFGFDGQEVTEETTYANYKEFDGIKKATKVESKRDGEKFIESTISDFKLLEKVDPKTFSEPE